MLLDPLAGVVTKTLALATETEDKLFDAPLSITKRGQLDQQVSPFESSHKSVHETEEAQRESCKD